MGWESLNKYYQFGLDRATGGIVFASDEKTSIELFHARMHTGSILSDVHVALMPTPNKRIMKSYLKRIGENGDRMAWLLRQFTDPTQVTICRATTDYGFNGSQIVVQFTKNTSYHLLQTIIKRAINNARHEGLLLVAGSSFGMPATRIYVTARKTGYAQMFLRISVGTEERMELEKLAHVIANSL